MMDVYDFPQCTPQMERPLAGEAMHAHAQSSFRATESARTNFHVLYCRDMRSAHQFRHCSVVQSARRFTASPLWGPLDIPDDLEAGVFRRRSSLVQDDLCVERCVCVCVCVCVRERESFNPNPNPFKDTFCVNGSCSVQV